MFKPLAENSNSSVLPTPITKTLVFETRTCSIISPGNTARLISRSRLGCKAERVSELLKERPIQVDQPAEVLQRVELESIAASSEIRDALKNDDLRRLISSIDNSVKASDDIDKAMGSDVFRIFAGKVLSAANASAIKQ